jgi:hypothetical protein
MPALLTLRKCTKTMKLRVKHKDTEIEIDDNNGETTIKYSTGELIKMLEKMSLEIQAIENNYNEITYGGGEQ